MTGSRLTLRSLGGTTLATSFVAFLVTHELVAFIAGTTHGFATAVARHATVQTEIRITPATINGILASRIVLNLANVRIEGIATILAGCFITLFKMNSQDTIVVIRLSTRVAMIARHTHFALRYPTCIARATNHVAY